MRHLSFETIRQRLIAHKQNLLPTTSSDLISKCSCPDYSNPCKHIAGTYFKVASLIDRDPFLLFQLRGMNKETMHKVLNGSSLGKALLAQQNEEQVSLSDKVAYRYTQPARISTEEIDEINHSDFWGSGQLPERQLIVESDQIVTAPIIRRQGHYPSFWQNNVSFIDSMEQVYQKIIVKNKDCL